MTKRVGIIVQARISSTRLPKKIILKVDEKMTFLDVLLKRIKKLKHKYPIVLACSNNESDSILESFAIKHKIKFFKGSENNVLDRFIKCADYYKIDTIVRICSDNPFIDIQKIEELIETYKGEDYLSFKVNNKPSILTHYGFFTEIVSLKALKKVQSQNLNNCFEHVTNCIYNNPDVFDIKFIQKRINNNNIRCTLDTEGDFNILKDIYINFIKDNFNANYLEVIDFISNRPDLSIKMKSIIKENLK